ncbi:MAG: endonuclease/exonuclease/phosphatase family protein [Acidobacteria bacterium]|nr:endonuclease/exonuclease/phosphatase family protein [Acidobacteriota bacterium]
MNSRTRLFPALAALLLAAGLVLSPAARASGGAPITLMTWNTYFGFDEGPLFAAAASGDPELIAAAVSGVWAQVHATDFHVRAAEIAKKVKAARPDLFGVQEAVQYVRLDGATFEPMEVIDHLAILIEALAAEGMFYEMRSVVEDTSVMLPDADGNVVMLLDRSAILVRVDLPPGQRRLAVSNPKSGTFSLLAELCIVPAADGSCEVPLVIKRGWASVDVGTKGAKFRFVVAHLEDVPAPVANEEPSPLEQLQLAQAAELTLGENGPFATDLRVILAGDFNTDAATLWPTYRFLTAPAPAGPGLKDAWLALHPKEAGLTWGPNPDLLAPFPAFTQRIDFVFLKGEDFSLVSADVVGNTRGDVAPSGLWPSDHAGLVVKLVP